jgi:erythrin-vacuolar iron transport family protein
MATQGIDYRNLSLGDALELAILVEEESKERYEELALQMRQFHTPEAAALFEQMARNEQAHLASLLARRNQPGFETHRVSVSRAMLFDVEAPEYSEARAFMTRRDALLVALRSEKKAHEFFLELSKRTEEIAIRELFAGLASEELTHQAMLRAELEREPADRGPQADVADEPVAL